MAFDFRAPVTLFQAPKGKRTSKTIGLTPGGKITKTHPHFTVGIAAVRQATLADLASLTQTQKGRYLVYGTPAVATDTTFVLAPTAVAERAGFSAPNLVQGIHHMTQVVTRTTDSFAFRSGAPGFLAIDYDAPGEAMGIDALLELLFRICPEMAGAPLAYWPTSSSFLTTTNDASSAMAKGWRVVVGVAEASDIPRAMGVLFERCFLFEKAHWGRVTEVGAILERAIVDRALRLPIQPDFVEPPFLCEGVWRFAPKPVILNAKALGLNTIAAVPELTGQEHAQIEAAKAILRQELSAEAEFRRELIVMKRAKEIAADEGLDYEQAFAKAKAAFDQHHAGVLLPEDRVHFDQFGWVPIAQVLLDTEKYDGKTCADPVEPFYSGGSRPDRNKAICVAGGLSVKFFSQIHTDGVSSRVFTVLEGEPEVRLFDEEGAGEISSFDEPEPAVPFANAADRESYRQRLRAETEAAFALGEAEAYLINQELVEAVRLGKTTKPEAVQYFFDASGFPVVEFGDLKIVDPGRHNERPLFKVDRITEDQSEASQAFTAAHAEEIIARGIGETVGAPVVCISGGEAEVSAVEVIFEHAAQKAVATNTDFRIDYFCGNTQAAQVAAATAGLTSAVMERRVKFCKKPKALKAVQEFMPRSTGSSLCVSTGSKCEFFGDCDYIKQYASQANVVIHSNFAALRERNTQIEQERGLVGVFSDVHALQQELHVPLADLAELASNGVKPLRAIYKRLAASLALDLSVGGNPELKRDVGAYVSLLYPVREALEEASVPKQVGVSPSMGDEEAARAVEDAVKQLKTAVPEFEICHYLSRVARGKGSISSHASDCYVRGKRVKGPSVLITSQERLERLGEFDGALVTAALEFGKQPDGSVVSGRYVGSLMLPPDQSRLVRFATTPRAADSFVVQTFDKTSQTGKGAFDIARRAVLLANLLAVAFNQPLVALFVPSETRKRLLQEVHPKVRLLSSDERLGDDLTALRASVLIYADSTYTSDALVNQIRALKGSKGNKDARRLGGFAPVITTFSMRQGSDLATTVVMPKHAASGMAYQLAGWRGFLQFVNQCKGDPVVILLNDLPWPRVIDRLVRFDHLVPKDETALIAIAALLEGVNDGRGFSKAVDRLCREYGIDDPQTIEAIRRLAGERVRRPEGDPNRSLIEKNLKVVTDLVARIVPDEGDLMD